VVVGEGFLQSFRINDDSGVRKEKRRSERCVGFYVFFTDKKINKLKTILIIIFLKDNG